MRLPLLCSALTALLLAAPAIAAPASGTASLQPHMAKLVDLPVMGAAEWNAMTSAEKKVLVRGVVEGIVSDGLLHGLLGGPMPVDDTTSDLYNYCATHQTELVAFLDKNYANPRVKVGIRAQVIGFFLHANPAYNKRMMGVAMERLNKLEKAFPQHFHSPTPAPSR